MLRSPGGNSPSRNPLFKRSSSWQTGGDRESWDRGDMFPLSESEYASNRGEGVRLSE